jgi:hypothetical protein
MIFVYFIIFSIPNWNIEAFIDAQARNRPNFTNNLFQKKKSIQE